ncbi:hypothetical protein [Micromonospora vulcania]|uniref:DUF397 domain-containing protein n=1 Tax=Micromonospora vulcania TaxID=1441873 RepID=A0ABW1HBM3_9ACTN
MPAPTSPDDRVDPAQDRLEVAIDGDLNRILRNSLRPDVQIRVSRQGWAAFIASIRSGQDY